MKLVPKFDTQPFTNPIAGSIRLRHHTLSSMKALHNYLGLYCLVSVLAWFLDFRSIAMTFAYAPRSMYFERDPASSPTDEAVSPCDEHVRTRYTYGYDASDKVHMFNDKKDELLEGSRSILHCSSPNPSK
ncbi:hypothetical protein M433DRAFT_165504 [Acidomyces richmondensis BFW]|nr:MAG: hypothetical protein FE78DRAFT_106970 [Acidomyces sp. 'richmondensis']KYG46132.1 hypothetical protein M433DRAFT_165504 [Acidomyces richmondensis BFW]